MKKSSAYTLPNLSFNTHNNKKDNVYLSQHHSLYKNLRKLVFASRFISKMQKNREKFPNYKAAGGRTNATMMLLRQKPIRLFYKELVNHQ